MTATRPEPAADLLHEQHEPAQHPEPVDADWPAREARGDSGDEPHGDPDDLHDEGVLESLGKAVSAPLRDAADDEPAAGKPRNGSPAGS